MLIHQAVLISDAESLQAELGDLKSVFLMNGYSSPVIQQTIDRMQGKHVKESKAEEKNIISLPCCGTCPPKLKELQGNLG